MYDEDDLLPISALSHLVFCERRCALMYIEGQWADNRFTVEGTRLHDVADLPGSETRGGVRTVRGLYLRSLRLGLSGRADVVEFHRLDLPVDEEPAVDGTSTDILELLGPPPGSASTAMDVAPGLSVGPDTNPPPPHTGVMLDGLEGIWTPFPVEYKRGRPKPDICDKVQLCAQALCLEEMLGVHVPAGALYYGQPRRREEVDLGPDLRTQTEALALRLHDLVRAEATPAAHYERKCRGCSLLDICLPRAAGTGRRSARRYLAEALAQACEEEPRIDETSS